MSRVLTLDELVARARAHKMTPAEKRAQRVSLIMGLRAKRSTLTREQVEEYAYEEGRLAKQALGVAD